MSVQQYESLGDDQASSLALAASCDGNLGKTVAESLCKMSNATLRATFDEEVSHEDCDHAGDGEVMIQVSKTLVELDNTVAICMEPLSLY